MNPPWNGEGLFLLRPAFVGVAHWMKLRTEIPILSKTLIIFLVNLPSTFWHDWCFESLFKCKIPLRDAFSQWSTLLVPGDSQSNRRRRHRGWGHDGHYRPLGLSFSDIFKENRGKNEVFFSIFLKGHARWSRIWWASFCCCCCCWWVWLVSESTSL